MIGILEEILATLNRQNDEIKALREEITDLHDRVEPMKDIYTIKEVWMLVGGVQLCSFKSFLKSKSLPRHDGYFHRMRAYRRDTVRAYMRKFTVRVPPRKTVAGHRAEGKAS